jgi:hypothetical protein
VGHRAFEDYYDNLRSVLDQYFTVTIVIYNNESELFQSHSINDDNVYLFLGHIPPHFLNLTIKHQYPNIYLINTEQSTRGVWTMIMQYYIKTCVNLIDYDQYQINATRSLLPNKEIFYLPYQITNTETEYLASLILKNTNKLYDVAFCSTNKSKRRISILTQLRQKGLSVINVEGWKNMRDEQIANAKILINVHYDHDYQIFEHMRCDRWALSGLLVVSENSLSDATLDCKDLITIEPYDQLVNKIVYIIDNYDTYYVDYLEKLMVQRKKIIEQRESYCLKLVETVVD